MTITVHAKHCYKDLEKLLSVLEILEIYLRKDWNHLTIETMSFERKFFSFKECNYPVRKKYKLNIEIRKTNQVRFHTKILRSLGSKIWNALPYHMKNLKTLILSKRLLKTGIEKIPNI